MCDPVESFFSMAKARRSQSMRTYTRANVESNLLNRSSRSGSSSSPSGSKATLVRPKTNPIASTSNQKATDTELQSKSSIDQNLKEIEIQPLVDSDTLHIRAASQLSLREASIGTHSGGSLNPARDGVRARVQNILQRNGASVAVAAAVGTGIGVGGFYIGKNLTPKTQRKPEHFNKIIDEYISSTPRILSTTTLKTITKDGRDAEESDTAKQNVNSVNNSDDDEITIPLK